MISRFAAHRAHNKQLADHAGALADILLHQLAAGHAYEGAVCVVRHRARQQRLPRAWRAVQQHALLGSTNTGSAWKPWLCAEETVHFES